MIVLGQSSEALTQVVEGLQFRPLEPDDRPRITAVVDHWWGRPMGDLQPRPFFSEFRSTSFIVERDGKVVAFLVDFLSQTNSDEAYTHAVAVAPAWRGRGLVRVLYERFGEVGKRRGRRRTRTITSLAEAAVASDWSSIAVNASAHAAFRRWFAWMLAGNSNGDQRDSRAASAAIRRRDGVAIGSTSFNAVYPEDRRVEIGMTWYARSEWSSDANVEAVLLMLTRAFELCFRRVEFKTDRQNVRSRGALEALPAQFEGVFRKHLLVHGGERRESAHYSVIDDDWPAVRANRERRLAKHRQRHELEGETAT